MATESGVGVALAPEQELVLLRTQLAAFDTLYALSLEMHKLLSSDEVFTFLAKELTTRLQLADCSFYVPAGEQLQLAAFFSLQQLSPPARSISMLDTAHPVSQCYRSKKSLLIQTEHQQTQILLVPVLSQTDTLALLHMRFSDIEQARTWRPLLKKMAGVISRKLNQLTDWQTLQQTVAQLEYASRLQRVLFNIASLQYDGDEPQSFYQQLQENVGELMYARNFFIAIYNREAGHFSFPYFADEFEHISPSQYYPDEIIRHSLTGYVFRTDQPLLADKDQLLALAEQKVVRSYGITPQCWLGVPFKSEDQVQGVLVVQSYDAGIGYQQADVELLQFVCQHISSALARAFVQQRLMHQALHDALTGLPNRLLFLDRVQHAFRRRQRYPDQVIAVAYLDLDRFKMVNDTLGHQVGDAFLIEVATVLQSCLRLNDTLARLGGDEFAILLEGTRMPADIDEVTARIAQKLALPIQVAGHQLQTSASIGVAFADASNQLTSTDELIRRADIAMYQAKQDGRGVCRHFSADMDQRAVRHYQLEMELQSALTEQQFVLHFQPVIDLASEDTRGFEALIRWSHPERGMVSPAEFIPMAEELGLLTVIDRYVLVAAIRQLKLWLFDYASPFYVSVNISGRSFSDAEFAGTVLAMLNEAGVPESSMEIEITEQALIDNIAQAKATIDELRRHGIRIFLDDFGTGYSSLSYLHEFSLDVLKIDRSFIAGIRPRVAENAVINTIVTLAKTLKLQVIAEGIETSLQRQLLTDLGCDSAQGYWFAPPLAAKDAISWLR
jgi:diguanylate cyclase (GGDEF)-like protein